MSFPLQALIHQKDVNENIRATAAADASAEDTAADGIAHLGYRSDLCGSG